MDAVTPIALEFFQILLFFFFSYASIICFLYINFKIWRWPLYPLIALDAGLFCGWALKTYGGVGHGAVGAIVAFFVGCSLFFKCVLKGRYKTPVYLLTPAFLYMCVLFVSPILFELYLAFHKLNLNTLSVWITGGGIEFAGLENFKDVLTSHRADGETLFGIAVRTFIWTALNVLFHVVIGLGLALVLNHKLRFGAVYRTILILPWAIPQLISILAWRGEFHTTFGFINQILNRLNESLAVTWQGHTYLPLAMVGIKAYEWWSSPNALFIACCIVNIWLGFPFMMIVSLSGLQSIPKSFYEAASIDGASPFQQFFFITLPQLKKTLAPASILGMIWTFNNINVIYLMSNGFKGADILVTDLYRQSFQYNRYSFSAAYSLITFLVLFLMTLVWMKKSKILQDS